MHDIDGICMWIVRYRWLRLLSSLSSFSLMLSKKYLLLFNVIFSWLINRRLWKTLRSKSLKSGNMDSGHIFIIGVSAC